MDEHSNKKTLMACAWCAECEEHTPHRIDDGRRGPCLICTTELPTPSTPPDDRQGSLFADTTTERKEPNS